MEMTTLSQQVEAIRRRVMVYATFCNECRWALNAFLQKPTDPERRAALLVKIDAAPALFNELQESK